MGVSPIDAPDAPTYITLDFEQGKPVALDGEKMSAKDIILKLNQIGGATASAFWTSWRTGSSA